MIPEIVASIQQIIQDGFAYEAEGSVFFDMVASDRNPGHRYTRLCLKSANSLDAEKGNKRDPRDFALWKASKPGEEPYWESPWGNGRPGWQIDGFLMANDIFPEKLDIYSDPAFAHKDNLNIKTEDGLAKYFLSAGNVLSDEEPKQPSENDFISMKDALHRYTNRQIRMFFLLHQWNNSITLSENAMKEAAAIEKSFVTFLETVKSFENENKTTSDTMVSEEAKNARLQLINDLCNAQNECDLALRDNFDTPRAIQTMRKLMEIANGHLGNHEKAIQLTLGLIGDWIGKMLAIFGLEAEGTTTFNDCKHQLKDILEKVAQFRHSIRRKGLVEENISCYDADDFLCGCDAIRDELLKDYGIVLEDRKPYSFFDDEELVEKYGDEGKDKSETELYEEELKGSMVEFLDSNTFALKKAAKRLKGFCMAKG